MATIKAYIYSEKSPTDEQKKRLLKFLTEKYGETELVWQESSIFKGGFRIAVNGDVYDWNANEKLRQFKNALESIDAPHGNIIPLIKEAVSNFSPKVKAEETGKVLSVGDGIVVADGLKHVGYGEIIAFECGLKGMTLDLQDDRIGIIVFGDCRPIKSGSAVRRTYRTAGVPVGNGFLGRVVNALGEPVDGGGKIEADGFRPIEQPAPRIIDRQPVNKPMQTGLLVIDALFPIGRGQRELIIGDRQTGKTAIALDTILSQKDNGVICVYVAIGQKASSVAQFYKTLRKYGADKYTVIVFAGAGESASMQYIAPYSGCSIAEYFMYTGKDALIIYDDLSKHAVAYRTISLLLKRSPGREAYPGDVFYLHSRLLERSAHLSDKYGGGSLTALPIVETQGGDVSAYIPTNIISITDGQIFLESELFFEGQRPAVNIGLSVSRVGGAAQTKAVKKSVGSLRLDLAQYRETEVFTQFSSDLDEVTRKQLKYGQGLMRLMRQPQSTPYSATDEAILLTAATAGAFLNVPAEEIYSVAQKFLNYVKTETGIKSLINGGDCYTDEIKAAILQAAREFFKSETKKDE